jgi:asparaginyl-tRNA synthetase
MIEPEMAFCDIHGDMDLAEDFIKYLIRDAMQNNPDDMDLFSKHVDKGLMDRLNSVMEMEFQRVTYTEAVQILKESGRAFDYAVEFGSNLQSEHERFLTEEYFKCPIIVRNYPEIIKPFYMRRNEDGITVAAMDVLVPGIGEIIGGSQREERPDVLVKNLEKAGLSPEEYWWYSDLRRYGTVPHSGFGMGFERMLMFVTGVSNIRDVIPFARTPGHAEF